MSFRVTLPFIESFDFYNVEENKWGTPGPSSGIDLSNTGISRTGPGCLLCAEVDGPTLLFPDQGRIIFGTAFNPGGGFPSGPTDIGQIAKMNSCTTGDAQVRIGAFNDGSICVVNNNDPVAIVIARSAAGVLSATEYNYIEVDAQIAALANLVVRVNGIQVINVTGVRTRVPGSPALVNQFQLKAFGTTVTGRHDDVYIQGDPGAGVPAGAAFYGAVRIYAAVAIQDAAPLDWTPLTGTSHFAMVREVPPDGDASYVFASDPGALDQYLYNLSGVPSPGTIPVVQHVMDSALVGAGSRVLASSSGGITSPQHQNLGPGYNMLVTPWVLDPVTGLPWNPADIPLRPFGPVIVL